MSRNRVNIEDGSVCEGSSVDLLPSQNLSGRDALVNIGISNVQSVGELCIPLDVSSIIASVMTVPTLMTQTKKKYEIENNDAVFFIGKSVNNIGPKWYSQGGSFCSVCHIGFTFAETYALYLRCKLMNKNKGIPRCVFCGKSLRTRSKSSPQSGFWDQLELVNNLEEKNHGVYK